MNKDFNDMAIFCGKQVLLFYLLFMIPSPLQCHASRPMASSHKTTSAESSIKIAIGATIGSTMAEPRQQPTQFVDYSTNSYRRILGDGCSTGNPIDDCWRCDPQWEQNRQSFADCAIGFGENAIGGKHGQIYVVTDDSDDDAVNPTNGTLRWAVIQEEPLWIIFERNMIIKLQQELIMNSYKTIDGRGANVHIAGGAGITIQYINNIIIHGIQIYDCVPTGPAFVRSSPTHYGQRLQSDGSAVSIFGASNIWLDHLLLAKCEHLLISAIEGSTAITISNNYFTKHDMVMLLGAHPEDTFDKVMQVTVAYNHFGPGLVQRMPRCRFGYFHVMNNDYAQWEMYAIGGSEAPTILSEGNRFLAPDDSSSKEVTKRVDDGGNNYGGWENWNWQSSGDSFLNGAFFTDSGAANVDSSLYAKATSFTAQPSSYVATLTAYAGPFQCGPGGYGSVCGSSDESMLVPVPSQTLTNSPCLSVSLSLAVCFLTMCALSKEWHHLLLQAVFR